MRIYVDELPKDCIDCPCESEYYCNLLNEDVGCLEWGEIHKGCPLKTLADHTKQVRKEVCEEIRKWCNRNFNWVGDGTGYDGQDYNEMIGSNNTINKLRELLDQIQDKGEQHG